MSNFTLNCPDLQFWPFKTIWYAFHKKTYPAFNFGMPRSEAETRHELIDPRLVDARFHRHSIRLKGYNYSQPGAYFITLVAREPGCIFGEIQAEEMILSRLGSVAQIVWEILPRYFPVRLDEWIVMPGLFQSPPLPSASPLPTHGRAPYQPTPP